MRNISSVAAIMLIGLTMVAGSFWGGNYKAADLDESITVTTDTSVIDTAIVADTSALFESRGYPNILRYTATVDALIDTSVGDGGDSANVYLAQFWNGTYTVVAADSGALPLTVAGYLTDDTLLAVKGYVWIWSVSVYDTISDTVTVAPDFNLTGEWFAQ